MAPSPALPPPHVHRSLPPPRPVGPPSRTSGGFTQTLAIVATAVGWALLFYAGAVVAFVDENINCTANRGEAYRRCVRDGDLTGIHVLAVVLALGTFAAVSLWRARSHAALVGLAGALLFGAIVWWVYGNLGGWTPERPFPYDPVSGTRANTVIAVGGLVGAATGLLVRSLGRRGGRHRGDA